MSGGRTTWWPCDAAEHDRELNVELGEEFGPGGALVMRVMKDLAGQQHADGRVRTGFRSLRRKTHIDDVETVRRIVERAGEIGALDDLEVDPDGRRFTCRVSGWEADQARGHAAFRKADERARKKAADMSQPPDPACDMSQNSPEDGDESRSVAKSHLKEITVDNKEKREAAPPVEPSRLDAARAAREQVLAEVGLVFDAWVAATERRTTATKLTADRRRRIEKALKSHGLEDCLAAVRHIGLDAWARGANDRGRRFDDIEHALGNSERIERWRDQQPRPASTGSGAGRDERRARGSAALDTLIGGGGAAA